MLPSKPCSSRGLSPFRSIKRLSPDITSAMLSIETSNSPSSPTCNLRRHCSFRGNSIPQPVDAMRRTVSLDTLQGTLAHNWCSLLLSKSTQTPSSWDCSDDVSIGHTVSGGDNVGHCCHHPIRKYSSNPTSPHHFTRMSPPVIRGGRRRTPTPDRLSSPPPLITGGGPFLQQSGENMEKFIRQRLQQQSRAVSLGGDPSHGPVTSARQSPVPGDHSLSLQLGGSPINPRHLRQFCTARDRSNSSNLPPLVPKTLLPRFRGSVEGLNQEIEGLVLCGQNEADIQLMSDGRRPPLPEYFYRTRSVNTQTCSIQSAPTSPHSQCCSPPYCQCSPIHSASLLTPSTPPPSSRINTSPHINKFLAREPPSGSRKVSLKVGTDERLPQSGGEVPPLQPSVPFTLRPSLGSAFCAPSPVKRRPSPPSLMMEKSVLQQ